MSLRPSLVNLFERIEDALWRMKGEGPMEPDKVRIKAVRSFRRWLGREVADPQVTVLTRSKVVRVNDPVSGSWAEWDFSKPRLRRKAEHEAGDLR